MKLRWNLLLLVGLALSATTTSVLARGLHGFGNSVPSADDIILGDPKHNGSGCRSEDGVIAELSPDAKELSILFSDYVTEAGGFAKRMDRKNCNVIIPVTVPQGYSVSIFQVDYRGFNSLPRGAMSMFSAEYFFAGARGPRMRERFRGPVEDDFYINNELVARSLVWTPCGDDVNLRINTSMYTRTNRHNDEALSMVDSIDVSAGMVYHLKWKRCRL